MNTGELHDLLLRCRAGEAPAWDALVTWIERRGRAILGPIRGLSGADREDVIADTRRDLLDVVRRGGISGQSNAEIDRYVCTAIRNRALNALRGYTRRHAAGDVAAPASLVAVDPSTADAAAAQSAPDERAIAAEQLGRIEKLVLSWPVSDRYVLLARLNGTSARLVQETLGARFGVFVAVGTVDTRFRRLRDQILRHLAES